MTRCAPAGVVGADGVERPADTLILGTGFTITEMPIAARVRGRDGRTLDEIWGGSPTGYLGTRRQRLPEPLHGARPERRQRPHLGDGADRDAGRSSRSTRCKRWSASGSRAPTCARTCRTPSTRRSSGGCAGTVWNAGGCRSYYLDRNGRNSTIFPGSTLELRRRCASSRLTTCWAGRQAATPRREWRRERLLRSRRRRHRGGGRGRACARRGAADDRPGRPSASVLGSGHYARAAVAPNLGIAVVRPTASARR